MDREPLAQRRRGALGDARRAADQPSTGSWMSAYAPAAPRNTETRSRPDVGGRRRDAPPRRTFLPSRWATEVV